MTTKIKHMSLGLNCLAPRGRRFLRLLGGMLGFAAGFTAHHGYCGPSSTPAIVQSPPASGDWPLGTAYQNFSCGGQIAHDGVGDTNGASNDRDIVGNATYPAAKFKTTTSFLFIRLRLDNNPIQNSGQTSGLSSFGWGIAFDTNGNRNNYEYAAIANGVSNKLQLYTYTGDGVSPAADPLREANFNMGTSTAWIKVTSADSTFSSNPDYYLDVAVPLTDLQNATASLSNPFQPGEIKLWIATSANGTTMSADYMCWPGSVANSDLANIPLTTAGIGAFAKISSPTSGSTLTTKTPTISGTATPGQTVTVALSSPAHSDTTVADATGSWTFPVPSSWGLLYGDINKTITASISGGGTSSSVSISISCPSGYQLPSDPTPSASCVNIDECTTTPTICGALTCTDTDGSYICGCNSGQTYNGTTCVSGSAIFTIPASWGTTFNTTTPALTGRFNATDAAIDPVYIEKKSDGDMVVIGGTSTPLNTAQILAADNPSWTPGPTPDSTSKQADTWSYTVPGSWNLLYGASYLVGVGVGTNATSQALKINIACDTGYEPQNHPTPSASCVDINECARHTDDCDPSHGVCTNLVGSFSCSCVANYTLTGGVCVANPTYSLNISSPPSSPTDDVTPTLSGTIARSDSNSMSPLSGILISITDGTNSSTFYTTAGGVWTYTIPDDWGWQIGQTKTLTLTIWSDSDALNLSLACGAGHRPASDNLSCELIPPAPAPAPTPAPTSTSTATSVQVQKTAAPEKISLSVYIPRPGEIFKTPTPTLSGTAEPGSTVTVKVDAKSANVTADSQGNWSFTVPAAWDLRKGSHILTVSDSSGASETVQWETTCADGQVYNVAGQCFKDEYILQGSGSQNLRVCGVVGEDGQSDTSLASQLGMLLLLLVPLSVLGGSQLRRLILGVLAMFLLSPSARAINVQIFKPVPDTNGLIGVTGSSPLNPGECWLGTYANKDVSPIELATPLGVRVSDVISELYTLDMAPTCGLGAGLTLTAAAPLHWVKQSGDFNASDKPKYEGLGDGDLMLRWTLRDAKTRGGLGLAVAPYVTVPSRKKIDVLGTEMNLLGESHYSGGLQGIADVTLGSRHYLASNLSYHHRPVEEFLNIRLEPEWRLAAGYGYLVHAPSTTQLTLEWHRREPTGRIRKDRFTAPTEFFTGISSQFFSPSSRLFAGASAGLSTGYGAPEYRIFSGLEIKLGLPSRDSDGDSGRSRLPAIDVKVRDESGAPLVADRMIVRNLDKAGRFTAEQQTSHATLGPLALGFHRLTVEKNGYKSENLGVAIKSGLDYPKVAVTLMPLGGQLEVTVRTKAGVTKSPVNFLITDQMPERSGVLDEETRSFVHIPAGLHTFSVKGQDIPPVRQGFVVTTASATLMVIDLRGPGAAKTRTTLDFGDIHFDTNKSDIKPESLAVLDKAVAVLKEHPSIRKITIEGYTDNQGRRAENIALSRDRSAAVRDYLTRHGVDQNRLTTAGFGPDSPVETNETPSGRRANRRVEFVVIELGESPR